MPPNPGRHSSHSSGGSTPAKWFGHDLSLDVYWPGAQCLASDLTIESSACPFESRSRIVESSTHPIKSPVSQVEPSVEFVPSSPHLPNVEPLSSLSERAVESPFSFVEDRVLPFESPAPLTSHEPSLSDAARPIASRGSRCRRSRARSVDSRRLRRRSDSARIVGDDSRPKQRAGRGGAEPCRGTRTARPTRLSHGPLIGQVTASRRTPVASCGSRNRARRPK